MIALKKILEQENDNEVIIDEFNQICVKIQEEYGDSIALEELNNNN